MSEPWLRWGIVGAGGIAHTVGAAIAAASGHTVAAVAARDRDRAQALATDLGAPSAYGRYDQLFADPAVDVVYVATVHTQHLAPAEAALAAGKAVLVEKPLTATAAQAHQLVECARVHGRFLAEALWTRYLPIVGQAVGLVADAAIGEVVGVRSTIGRHVPFDPAHRLWDPAVGGGVLFDLGIYVAHLAGMFIGRPQRVQVAGRRGPNGVESTAAMLWSTADRRYADLVASFDGWSDQPSTTVSGTHGSLSLFGPTQVPTRLEIRRPDQAIRVVELDGRPTGYQPEIVEVGRCVRAGLRESPLAPLAESLWVLDVLEAARSALRAANQSATASPRDEA
jgi:predicted dehydrogenase